MISRQTLACVLFAAAAPAFADAPLQQFVEQAITQTRDSAGLPATAALVQIKGRIEAQAASGKRALNQKPSVTTRDRWHIGSDTKAMTATLIARLVERGLVSFDSTLAQLFPGVAAGMNSQLQGVTLRQLLTHTAGLPALADPREIADFDTVIGTRKSLRAQRAMVVAYYLRQPPASKVGEFAYSNLGYVIAGAVVESLTGDTWEDALRAEVWKPLGIVNASFGAPGKRKKYDQPLGHVPARGGLVALDVGDPKSDNPPAVGPAGTVNITLQDWMLFAQDQLDGLHGHGKLLKPETYKLLHTPVKNRYAMGWGVLTEPNGDVSLLAHTGSNGYWVADLRILPQQDVISIVVTNAGGEKAEKAVRDLSKYITDRVAPN
ncbi:MAG: serine hydrolase domain-containing protein [Pseudomonadota bacterium]